jgi:hypothetical protein
MNIYSVTTPTPGNPPYGLDYVGANLTGTYALSNNLTINSDWTPIGYASNFSGIFTASSLGALDTAATPSTPYYTNDATPYSITFQPPALTLGLNPHRIGFFSALDGATIDSVTLKNVQFSAGPPNADPGTSSGAFMGALAGQVSNSTVSNVSITGTSSLTLTNGVNNDIIYMGGLFGSIDTSSVVQNISSSASVLLQNSYTYNTTNPIFYLGSLAGYVSNSTVTTGTNTGATAALTSIAPGSFSSQSSIHIGGAFGYTTNASISSISTSANVSINNTANPVGTITNLSLGGVIGTIAGGGNYTAIQNTGSVSSNLVGDDSNTITNLYQGGVVGNNAASSLTGSSNTGSIIVNNGYPNNFGRITGVFAVGGFAGNSTTSINGSSTNPNTTSGAVTVIHGNDNVSTGSIGSNVYIGGFSGNVSGSLNYAQAISGSSVSVTLNDGFSTSLYVSGLAGNISGLISNSSSVSNIYYTQNTATSGSIYVGGLGGFSGSGTNNCFYNGSISATLGILGSVSSCFFMGGVLASSGSGASISGTSLGSASSLLLTNAGYIPALCMGGLSPQNSSGPLSISGSYLAANSSLGIINTSQGQIGSIIAGGLVGNSAALVTLSQSYNQGNFSLRNSGIIDPTFYYGGIIGSPHQNSTLNQTFSSGNVSIINSETLATNGNISIGGFGGQGATTGNFTATDNYSTGSIDMVNSGTHGPIYAGGFMGRTLSASVINTSYSRSSVSLSNTGTLNGTTLGSFSGSNSGTISNSYVLQSELPPVGNGSSTGITSLQPLQIVQQKSFPTFSFGNIWSIQEFLTSPYFINSTYIPYFPGFE